MDFGLCFCEHGHWFMFSIIRITGHVQSNASWSLFVRTQLSFHAVVNITQIKNTNVQVEHTSIQLNICVHKNTDIVHFNGVG